MISSTPTTLSRIPTRAPPKSKRRQQRYRDQKREHLEHLENDVQQLHRTIARCEGQLEVLRVSVCSHDGALHTAAEFFSLFRHGYHVPRPHLKQRQDAFLRSVMRPDLVIMNERGLEKLFAQWQAYYQLFPCFEMVTPALDVLVCDETRLVRAPATLHLRLSRYALESLCPHVLQNERLVQRLVGQVLSMPTMIHFHFQDDGTIGQMDTSTNIVAALIGLLGSTEEALAVSDGAQIKANGELPML
ncbi:hypothetical protein SPRG_20826 [Saprolegnia parasitica CBS 223.65]|uniref:BZIP domain-containing protein n=1 Tax=Saprolegnia parasitica (strain CBS 223.65) TaxID=695850 RepID=A0A067C6M0_SAPPC|nr:hypothetical protein SPRG_20826 [Saprolegnia parasitica CBS 223.65]KDO24795.1 hypothetical protein SPRG_20826 [Saprolegnia parasitica CBS 223.65]|eukprot:XP_012204528.1 hypothetical protein SPRG_20826 [Saprolegnia parasitica CBS 223.65]